MKLCVRKVVFYIYLDNKLYQQGFNLQIWFSTLIVKDEITVPIIPKMNILICKLRI